MRRGRGEKIGGKNSGEKPVRPSDTLSIVVRFNCSDFVCCYLLGFFSGTEPSLPPPPPALLLLLVPSPSPPPNSSASSLRAPPAAVPLLLPTLAPPLLPEAAAAAAPAAEEELVEVRVATAAGHPSPPAAGSTPPPLLPLPLALLLLLLLLLAPVAQEEEDEACCPLEDIFSLAGSCNAVGLWRVLVLLQARVVGGQFVTGEGPCSHRCHDSNPLCGRRPPLLQHEPARY